jgi:hypothetical protein
LAIVATGIALGRRRTSPAARERKRRLTVNAKGRMAGATVVDFRGDELFYSYTVRGAQYTAAQDVSGVRASLPSDVPGILGPATVKYHPANPANSILVCEEWSGLRSAGPKDYGGERSLQ